MMFKRLALIGCGFMGGSLALAARAAHQVDHIVGYSRSLESATRAKDLSVIDEVATSLAEAVRDADLVVIATPVSVIGSVFAEIAPHLKADALVMDLGSTKSDVCQAAEENLGDRLANFVPTHPMAGAEKFGVEHAKVDLYRNQTILLTPLPQTSAEQLKKAEDFWWALKVSRTIQFSPKSHDDAMAVVSHFPHFLDFALMAVLSESPYSHEQDPFNLAGKGFEDTTRIAASHPGMWRDIVLANKDAVLKLSRELREKLESWEALLEDDDAPRMEAAFEVASQVRRGWKRYLLDTPVLRQLKMGELSWSQLPRARFFAIAKQAEQWEADSKIERLYVDSAAIAAAYFQERTALLARVPDQAESIEIALASLDSGCIFFTPNLELARAMEGNSRVIWFSGLEQHVAWFADASVLSERQSAMMSGVPIVELIV